MSLEEAITGRGTNGNSPSEQSNVTVFCAGAGADEVATGVWSSIPMGAVSVVGRRPQRQKMEKKRLYDEVKRLRDEVERLEADVAATKAVYAVLREKYVVDLTRTSTAAADDADWVKNISPRSVLTPQETQELNERLQRATLNLGSTR